MTDKQSDVPVQPLETRGRYMVSNTIHSIPQKFEKCVEALYIHVLDENVLSYHAQLGVKDYMAICR